MKLIQNLSRGGTLNEMVYMIAEAGVDHEGSRDRAGSLLRADHNAKVDCFKIQYYAEGFWGEHRELPWLLERKIHTIKDWCDGYDMDFLITPHDQWSLDFIYDLGLDTIKIGSGDWGLLDAAIATKKELIISTGGKSDWRVRSLRNELNIGLVNYKILHCMSLYPCPSEKAYISRIT